MTSKTHSDPALAATVTPAPKPSLQEKARVKDLEVTIAQQKRELEALRAHSDEEVTEQYRHAEILSVVFDNLGEGLCVVNPAGEFMLFNAEARSILGKGPTKSGPQEWSNDFGLFKTDRTTQLPLDELPLWRALRGEVVNDFEIFVRNGDVPLGRLINVSARPLKNPSGKLLGAVATFRDITDFRRAQQQLYEQTVTDDMTMIPNHRAFWERLKTLYAEGNRGRRFCLVMVDIDHFKKLNDTYGHLTGDYVLIALANALSQNVRATDFAARYGGEEFCILYTDIDEKKAAELADKLRLAVMALDAPTAVTASFGVCEFSRENHSEPQGLIRDADAALYYAKNHGRNRVCMFSELKAIREGESSPSG